MFSKPCEYGLRALTIIAKTSDNGQKIGIKDICRASNTPESFTSKILQLLVKRGILNSQKGPSGGFYLTKKPDEIRLYEIVKAIDGTEVFSKCGMGLDECNANNPCPLHFKFEVVRNELRDMCLTSTLDDLVIELSEEVYNR